MDVSRDEQEERMMREEMKKLKKSRMMKYNKSAYEGCDEE